MSDSDNTRDSIVSLAAGHPTVDNSDGKVKGKETKKIVEFWVLIEAMCWIKNNFIVSVDILLNATGNVPIMKKRKWTVDQEKQLSWVIRFIHKYLKLDPEEKLVSFDRLFEEAVHVSSVQRVSFSFHLNFSSST